MREGFVKFVATWSTNVQDVILYTFYNTRYTIVLMLIELIGIANDLFPDLLANSCNSGTECRIPITQHCARSLSKAA